VNLLTSNVRRAKIVIKLSVCLYTQLSKLIGLLKQIYYKNIIVNLQRKYTALQILLD
jgi:hypothetical protein